MIHSIAKSILIAGAASALCLAPSLVSACGAQGPTAKSMSTPDALKGGTAAKKDIVDTAVATGGFTTLVTAVKAAGLVDTLKGTGPFTVFAPTDEAFAKLPKGTLEALLKDKAKLTSVLTYHVVPGTLTSSAISGVTQETSIHGGLIPVSIANGVQVAGANVIRADIATTNGVIHVIDSVMLPPGFAIN